MWFKWEPISSLFFCPIDVFIAKIEMPLGLIFSSVMNLIFIMGNEFCYLKTKVYY